MTNAAVGHFQETQATPFVQRAAAPVEQQVAKRIEGRVTKINKEQGFGYLATEQGALFFHQAQLVGCHYTELNAGDVMLFDVVFNFVSGKRIAKNVSFVEAADRTIGHCQRMEAAKFTTTSAVQSVNVTQLNVTGTIVQVNADHGFIDCEHELVFFHYNQLCGTIMSELEPGMTVGFNKMFNNTSKKIVAHSVKIVDQPLPVGHFIDMTTGVAQTKASTPNATELSDKQLMFQTCERPARTSSGLQAAKNLLQVEAAAFVRRLSSHGNVFVNELLEVPKEETAAAPRSRKGSIMSDLFLTPSGRTSRRGSICSARR
jgi:cold shock CspA family protein